MEEILFVLDIDTKEDVIFAYDVNREQDIKWDL